MKKKLFCLAAVTICVATLASGTLAYFTAEDQVHNVITTGGVDIQIEEWQGEIGTPYPNDKMEVMPGVTVSKIATVKNLENTAYIRAKFDIVMTKNNNVMELSPETLESIITLTMNDEDWIRKEGDEDWWYYNSPVKTGESTAAFFTEAVFSGPNMTNEYQNCTVEVIVSAQAVQTANNGDSVLEADGWSAEE